VSSILSNFPKQYDPNPAQVHILKDLELAIQEGHKFIVCNAPTGSGKSLISKTLANLSTEPSNEYKELVNSYRAYANDSEGSPKYADELEEMDYAGCTALTITKSLQDQYKTIFDDAEVLKGKSNYCCEVDDSVQCDIAPCMLTPAIKKECWATNLCPYYEQRNKTLTSVFSALNYSMFFNLPEQLKKREYIVCDEASELEDEIVKAYTCVIKFKTLKSCGVQLRPVDRSTYQKLYRWVESVGISLADRIGELKEDLKSKSLQKPAKTSRKKMIVALENLRSRVSSVINTWDETEYVFENIDDGIQFLPLKVNNLAQNLFKHGKIIILMSATIIDPKNFCKTLGIEKFKYIESESTFDPEKSPIYCTSKVKLNYHNLKSNLPKIVKTIRDICKEYPDSKGIIHSHSNYITSYIKNNFKSDRCIFREAGVNNEMVVEEHTNSDYASIIVSPSLTHGVDLKDDLARFQIIIKAPYLPTTDKRIEQLMKKDFKWYLNKMLCVLIQASGRGTRSAEDYCDTYVLDGAIAEAVINNKGKLPKYFIERFA
jgi:Rad3-related DNA helicase|tara:strand:- start:8 stop:1639 length:1632 start_codon:yes stop_codon:yes gene_type:complete